MIDYLIQVKFESRWFANLVANPQNREEIVKAMVEKLGGKIKGFWFSTGEYDVVTIWSMPDIISMKAIGMAIDSTGNLKEHKLTPLLSNEEGIEAMRKAQTIDVSLLKLG